jgi:type II secretory pathway component PulK
MNKESQKGQAVITLLFFVAISVAIITAMSFIVFNNITAGANIEQGAVAYYAAETGAENALLRLLRDPDYAGETMIVDDSTVEIEVDAGVITSTATFENSVRKIEVQTVYNNNVLTISSWREIN